MDCYCNNRGMLFENTKGNEEIIDLQENILNYKQLL